MHSVSKLAVATANTACQAKGKAFGVSDFNQVEPQSDMYQVCLSFTSEQQQQQHKLEGNGAKPSKIDSSPGFA